MSIMNHPDAVTLINSVDLLADRDGELTLSLKEHLHDNRLESHEAEQPEANVAVVHSCRPWIC